MTDPRRPLICSPKKHDTSRGDANTNRLALITVRETKQQLQREELAEVAADYVMAILFMSLSEGTAP
jgi:hypothetical protein